MIRKLSKGIQGPIGKTLVILFCIPFALFGAEAFLAATSEDSYVGKVNGEALSRYELARLTERLASQLGEREISDELDRMVKNVALNSLIRQELLLQVGEKIGVRLPVSILNESIRSLPDFQQDGQYSPALFGDFANDLGLGRDELRLSLERQLLLYLMESSLRQIFAGASAEQLLQLWWQQRDLSYLELEHQDFLPTSLPAEESRAFYEQHQEQFQTSPEVDLSLLEMPAEEIEKRAGEQVSDEQVQAAYQAYVNEQVARSERRAAHIMLPWQDEGEKASVQAQADELYGRLQAGEDFADLARAYSQDFSAEQGGDLGYSQGDSFPPEFEQVLQELQPGAFSAPVEIEQAIHIIRLMELRQGEVVSFEQHEARLREQLVATARATLQQELLEQMSEMAYSAASVAEIGEEVNLEVRMLDGVRPEGEEGASELSDQARKQAFSADLLSGGFISNPVQAEDGSIIMFQVRSHRPSRQQSFVEVEEQAQRAVARHRAAEIFATKAMLVDEAMAQGWQLERAARDAGLSARPKLLAGLERASHLLDESVLDAAFALPAQAGQWVRVDGEERATWVYLVAARKAATVIPEQSSYFAQQLDQRRTEVSTRLLLGQLKEAADIQLKAADEQGL